MVTFESVPQVEPVQPEPESVQVAPLFCASFCSEVVKPWVPMPACTLGALGLTVTMIVWGVVTVMVAEAVCVVSAVEVAVSVTVAGEGTVVGAV